MRIGAGGMAFGNPRIEQDGKRRAAYLTTQRRLLVDDGRRDRGPEAGRDQTGSRVISRSLIVAAALGFLLVVFLIVRSGAAEVASAMLVLGWRLAPIALYHLAPLSFDALSWRELVPPSARPRFLDALQIRWIRESLNS